MEGCSNWEPWPAPEADWDAEAEDWVKIEKWLHQGGETDDEEYDEECNKEYDEEYNKEYNEEYNKEYDEEHDDNVNDDEYDEDSFFLFHDSLYFSR